MREGLSSSKELRVVSSPASELQANSKERQTLGEASAGYCGRHGLFTGRMCSPCAEEAASVPASERGEFHAEGLDERGIYGGRSYPASVTAP